MRQYPREGGVKREGRRREIEREREREFETKRDKEVLPTLLPQCIILHLMCVRQCEACCLCVVCDVHTHTPPMTHPKPRPARIQFESQVWRVQLRGTNAA